MGTPLPLSTLPESLGRALGLDPADPLVGFGLALLSAAFVGTLLLVNAAVAGPWMKRKIAASFWDKVGPNRHGPAGVLIIVADAVRLLSKELVVPEGVDRPAWDLAPLVVAGSALLGFAVIPMGNGLHLADPEGGVVYVFAVASVASVGLVMAGYASGNKFSLLGGLRAVATNLAYEIPLVLVGASAVLFAGTLRTSEVVAVQQAPLATVAGVTIPQWFAFVNPLAFALFLVANLAEVGRNPFDIAEAPTEIVAGYQTEYSGVYFVLLYLGEFLHIFLGGAIAATLFLGGPAGPVLPGVVWFFVKMWGVFMVTQWARSAVPRLRPDQVLGVGWKGLLVLSFLNLVVTALLLAFVV